MPRLSRSQRDSFPAARYIGYRQLAPSLPIVIGVDNTIPVPFAATAYCLDFSGFNTLSVFLTASSFAGANSLAVYVNTLDPEATVQTPIPSNLGRATLGTIVADDDYAFTLYLPDYYSGLTGLVLPFFMNILEFTLTGGAGAVQLDAIKLWLTNTGTGAG